MAAHTPQRISGGEKGKTNDASCRTSLGAQWLFNAGIHHRPAEKQRQFSR
jgi:hypothetical protein